MAETVAPIWDELENEAAGLSHETERLIRSLGKSAIGIRAGYVPQQSILELFIEVPIDWSGEGVIPEWRGMGHEVLALGLPPRTKAHHLRLFLVSTEHREVFLMVCEDLVESLEGIEETSIRVKELEACLLRWRRFFEKAGLEGLSPGMQQGLFAELTWLQRLLDADMDPLTSASAWKGCERNYHDFDIEGHIIEVKSTRTKELHSVTINNERQLDDTDLQSLHLYALIVHETEGGGMTLPERVAGLRTALENYPAALAVFNSGLISAGYLDRHAPRYYRHLISKAELLYRVAEGFPRIISMPTGVGDLRYRVLLAACEPFREDLDDHLKSLVEL